MFCDCSKCPVTLESFCDKDPGRYALGLPRQVGDYVYAFDGHVCVRIHPGSYSGPIAMEGRFPNVAALDWDKAVCEWGPIPEPEDCKKCKCRRVTPFESEDYDNTEDANLWVPCPKCWVHVGGRRLAWRLVEPLIRFGTGLVAGVSDDNPKHPVHFRFNEGYALVMGLDASI